MLAFNSVYFSEISLFNGLRPFGVKKSFPVSRPGANVADGLPFHPPRRAPRAPPRALVSGQGERITRISVFSKQLSKKFRCPPFAPPMDSLVRAWKGCEAATASRSRSPVGDRPKSRGSPPPSADRDGDDLGIERELGERAWWNSPSVNSVRGGRGTPAELDLAEAHGQRNGGEREEHQHPEHVHVG